MHAQRQRLACATATLAESAPDRGPTAQLIDGELEVRYQPGPGVLAELQDLVAEERVGCAFVSWTVTEDSGQPVLRATA